MRSNVKSLVDDSEDEAQLRSSRGVDDIQERRIKLEMLIGIECCPVAAGAWSVRAMGTLILSVNANMWQMFTFRSNSEV